MPNRKPSAVIGRAHATVRAIYGDRYLHVIKAHRAETGVSYRVSLARLARGARVAVRVIAQIQLRAMPVSPTIQ